MQSNEASQIEREVEELINDISEMAAHIGRRFVPDPEKRRIFQAAATLARQTDR